MAPAGAGPEPAPKPVVLVVDDEPQVLLAIEDVLSDEFTVLQANSAKRALEVMQEHGEIAAIISDQRMPQMNGDEFLERASQLSGASRILFTGFADIQAVVRAVNNGRIFAYLTKPWNPDEVRQTVRRGVEQFTLASELAQERQLLHDLMDSTPDAIYFKDRDLRYVRVNRAFARLASRGEPEEVHGKTMAELGFDAGLIQQVESRQRELLQSGGAATDEFGPLLMGDRPSWQSTTHAAIRGQRDQVFGLLGISRDVTQRKQHEERISRLTRFHSVLSSISSAAMRRSDRAELLREACAIAVREGPFDLVFVCDRSEQDGSLSVTAQAGSSDARALAPLLSAQLETDAKLREQLEAKRPAFENDVANAADSPLKRELQRLGQGAFALLPLLREGRIVSVFALLSRHAGCFDVDEMALLIELADNISFALDHLAQTAQLNFLAYFDELTKLPKRELLLDRLAQLLSIAQADGPQVGLVLVDIGRFRRINESLGRRAGDALLCSMAERLRAPLQAHETVARSDGNTFALLLSPVTDAAQLALRIESELIPLLRVPYLLGETELRVPHRVAIALGPSDGSDAETLLRNAEAALLKTRSSGERYVFYAPSMNEQVAEKLALENRLRRAIEAEEFVLYYQPKVDLKSGRIVGLEALIRWRDPVHGLIAPGRFIPVLEETGLILDVGRWVFRQAAAQFTAWQERGLNPPPIAVNVSSLELGQSDFLSTIAATSAIYPLVHGGVDLEITESVLMDDLHSNIEKLQNVREQGLRVAIDDFGTGYSSLGYLARLPIDALKVDRSFVWRMGENPQDMTIVMTIISLAHALDLKVIAEGPETFHQAHLLRLLKCDQIQGFLVSEPRPADEVVKMLGMKLNLDSITPPH
jgi:diguanylate cyclase (GGDEF)-like protein/PAS domain S-box-containing protein